MIDDKIEKVVIPFHQLLRENPQARAECERFSHPAWTRKLFKGWMPVDFDKNENLVEIETDDGERAWYELKSFFGIVIMKAETIFIKYENGSLETLNIYGVDVVKIKRTNYIKLIFEKNNFLNNNIMALRFSSVEKAYKVFHELKVIIPDLRIPSWPEDMSEWLEDRLNNPEELVVFGWGKKSDDGWESISFFIKNPSKELKKKFDQHKKEVPNSSIYSKYSRNKSLWVIGWF